MWCLSWLLVVAVCVGCFFAIGAVWSYVAGLALAGVVLLASYEALKRWNRARWLRRFPELAELDFSWRPDPEGSRLH